MERTVVVQGNLSDPSHIELDEPVSDIQGRVQVTVRPLEEQPRVPLFESATEEEVLTPTRFSLTAVLMRRCP